MDITLVNIITFLISFTALLMSFMSYKRSVEIEMPEILNVHTTGNSFVFILNDFSRSKNLNIRQVKVKPYSKWKILKPSTWHRNFVINNDFDVSYNSHSVPQQVTIRIGSLNLMDGYKFKLMTNFRPLRHTESGIFYASQKH